jgi:hypothetical protein
LRKQFLALQSFFVIAMTDSGMDCHASLAMTFNNFQIFLLLPLSGGMRQSFCSESISEKKNSPIYTIGEKCKIYASSEKKN